MPGGPTGRGCEACRAQKKKCDLQQPACSRCQKLRIPCQGVGRQRFRFVNHGPSSNNQESGQNLVLRFAEPAHIPSNEKSRLCDSMVARLRSSNDVRYNIAWTWGEFLNYLPIRIGKFEALDSAVVTLLTSHTEFCLKHRNASPSEPLVAHETEVQYNKALRELRIAVGDPKTASRIETLLTVMVLAITQGRMEGPVSSWSSAHMAGALQIMRLRKWPTEGRNDLETYLYHHLRQMVIGNSFVNPAVILTDHDYRQIEKAYAADSPGFNFFVSGLRASEAMTQTRSIFARGTDTTDMKRRIERLNENSASQIALFRDRLHNFSPSKWPPEKAGLLLVAGRKTYGFCISIHAMLLCVRRALSPEDAMIPDDAAQLSEQALQLAEESKVYRPLGGLWAVPMLMAVWCVTIVPETKQDIEDMILDYRRQALGSIAAVPKKDMEWMAKRLDLRGSRELEFQLPLLVQ